MTENIDKLIKEAKELTNQERFDEALEILEKLFTDNPHSEDVKKSLLETLFIYGGYLNDEYILQYEKAKDMFKRIIEIDPTNYRAHYNLGIANFNLDDLEKAKDCYEEAARIKPDYQYCFYNIGLVYETKGDLQEALKYYEKALEIDPTFPYALSARSSILSNLDELKKSSRSSNQQKNIKHLKSLLEVSKRVRIDMIQSLLNIEKEEFLDLLIGWCKKYKFEIDGDFLIINKETLPDLINSLDE
ncbi:MAG: tetratricopeptide repeat protein [Promethearchaeota archaeon]